MHLAIMDARQKKFAKAVGARVQELRRKAGHSNRADFAYENGIDRTQLARVELGTDIRLSTLHRVLDALAVTPKEFFSEGFY